MCESVDNRLTSCRKFCNLVTEYVLSRFDIENNVAMEESGGLHVESGVVYPHPDDPQKSRNTALRRCRDSTNRVWHRTDILQDRPEAAESGEIV